MSQNDTPATGAQRDEDFEAYQDKLDELSDGLLEAYAAGFSQAVETFEIDDVTDDVDTLMSAEPIQEGSYYYWDGKTKPLQFWLRDQFVDDEQFATDGGEDTDSPVLVQEQSTQEFGLHYPDEGIIETYDGNGREELDVDALAGENWQEADEENLRSSIEEDVEEVRNEIYELRHRSEELTDEQERELDRLESRLESQENVLEIAKEFEENHAPPESINQLVTAGAHGFAAVDGPFLVEREGTKWTITVPLDEDDALAPSDSEMLTLKSMQKGESAVLVADGKAVGGGVIELTYKPDGEDERHIVVDQYAGGDL